MVSRTPATLRRCRPSLKKVVTTSTDHSKQLALIKPAQANAPPAQVPRWDYLWPPHSNPIQIQSWCYTRPPPQPAATTTTIRLTDSRSKAKRHHNKRNEHHHSDNNLKRRHTVNKPSSGGLHPSPPDYCRYNRRALAGEPVEMQFHNPISCNSECRARGMTFHASRSSSSSWARTPTHVCDHEPYAPIPSRQLLRPLLIFRQWS